MVVVVILEVEALTFQFQVPLAFLSLRTQATGASETKAPTLPESQNKGKGDRMQGDPFKMFEQFFGGGSFGGGGMGGMGGYAWDGWRHGRYGWHGWDARHGRWPASAAGAFSGKPPYPA